MTSTAPGVPAHPAGSVGRGRLDAGLTRLGLRSAVARDRALAVALAVLTAAALGLLTGPLAADLDVALTPARRALFVGLSVAQALTLVVRRTRPPLCLLLVTGLQVLVTATVASEATVRGVPVVLAFGTAGAWLPLGRLLRWGGLAVAVEVALTPLVDAALRVLLPPGPGVGSATGPSPATWALGAASIVVVYGAAAAVGVTVATRRRNVALLEARAAAVEAEREAETRRAVEAERLRMARELHDVAAHHLTGPARPGVRRRTPRDPGPGRRPRGDPRGAPAGQAGARQPAYGRRRAARRRGRRCGPDGCRPRARPRPGGPGRPRGAPHAGSATTVALHVTGTAYPLRPGRRRDGLPGRAGGPHQRPPARPGQPVAVAAAPTTTTAVRLSVINRRGAASDDAGGRRASRVRAGRHARAGRAGRRRRSTAGPVRRRPAWRVRLGPAPRPASAPRSTTPPEVTRVIRLVLVDDQAVVRAGFRVIFESAERHRGRRRGLRADRSAVAVVAATRPDVVCMDVRMPGGDGIDGDPARSVARRGAGARPCSSSPPSTSTSTCSAPSRPAPAASCSRTPSPTSSIAAVRRLADGARPARPGGDPPGDRRVRPPAARPESRGDARRC